MQHVTDTSYDAYLEGVSIAQKEADIGLLITAAEDELEDVRSQLAQIEDTCTYYMQDGQQRIKGYRLEEHFEELCAQQEYLEQRISDLEDKALNLYWDEYNCDEGVKQALRQHNHWLWNSRAAIWFSHRVSKLSGWLWNQMYNKNR